jgi:hypothetical protein
MGDEPVKPGTVMNEALPSRQIDLLVADVMDAIEFGITGRTERGYETLLSGLRRAEWAAARGEVWAPFLRQRYLRALDQFARNYDDYVGPTPEAEEEEEFVRAAA